MKTIDQEFLSRILNVYLSSRPLFYAFIRPQEALLFHQHQANIKAPILDFGCGDGFFAYTVFGPKSINVGLDVAASRIAETNQWPAYKQTVIYDGRKIPFPDNYFHTVISNCVFEHLPDIKVNLREIHRVLRPGGHLLTSVATDNWERNFWGNRLFGKSYSRWWRQLQVHPNLFTAGAWENLFIASGFSPQHSAGYINASLVHSIELAHYLSWPSAITYKLFRQWILWPKFPQHLHTAARILPQLAHSLSTPTDSSGANFYVLKKSEKTTFSLQTQTGY